MPNQQTFVELFETHRKELLEYARWIAVKVANENEGYCNIDLVREQVSQLPKFQSLTVDPRVFGAVFKSSEWQNTGNYIPSQRPENHKRPIAVFRLRAWQPKRRDYTSLVQSSLFNS